MGFSVLNRFAGAIKVLFLRTGSTSLKIETILYRGKGEVLFILISHSLHIFVMTNVV